MPSLDVSSLTEAQRPTGIWAAALLHAIARDETAGRRTLRLTESKLDTWTRFRGRLEGADFVSLLFEDAAVIHPVPFDATAVGGAVQLDKLPTAVVDTWLKTVSSLQLTGSGADYVAEQARLLGLSTRMGRSELHVIRPHHKVLELPGTGGQLAYHLVAGQKDLSLQNNFSVACGTWQELTLAGIIGLELGSPHSEFITALEPDGLRNTEHPLRQRGFDFVIGLHPDKGGQFQIEDQLAIWFPTAKVLLV